MTDKHPCSLRGAHVRDTCRVLLVNYLDLSGSRAFSLLLCALWVFSWFLDEGKRFIHDWCVVYMGRQRAGRTGCWTPGRRGALWLVKHRGDWHWWLRWCWWCSSLGSSSIGPAQCPLSPGTLNHENMSHLIGQSRVLTLSYHRKHGEFTNLSSSVRPLSWLRLRLIGYTVGPRARSFVICLYLSSPLRCG